MTEKGDKKIILVLAGSQWQIPIVEKIREMGFSSLIINLHEDSPAFKVADYWEVADILDKEKCAAIAEKYAVAGVVSEQFDIAMPTVAYIAKKLSLPALKRSSADFYTNKLSMREFCQTHGFSYPDYALCRTHNEVLDFFNKTMRKINIKPLDSNSSRGLAWNLGKKQYFYCENGVVVEPSPGDHVIDGGACLGDTAVVFSHAVGETGRVYSFEPNKVNLKLLEIDVSQHVLKNIKDFPAGLSNQKIVADPVTVKDSCDFGFSINQANRSGQQCPQERIDDLVSSGQVERVDFIKMDIEGAELEALQGGVKTLQKYRPKLAISLYHQLNDFFEIINFLSENCPFYRFYINHYTIHTEETVLYAISE